jgi:hypothetical protein
LDNLLNPLIAALDYSEASADHAIRMVSEIEMNVILEARTVSDPVVLVDRIRLAVDQLIEGSLI